MKRIYLKNNGLTGSAPVGYSGFGLSNGNIALIDQNGQFQQIQGGGGGTGATGPAGATGSSGTSGTSGSSGNSGSSGTSGNSGTSGTSGNSGTSGTSGNSGTSGTSGLLSLTGSTTNGLITYDGSGNNATVESSLTFDGSILKSPNFESTFSSGDEGGEIKLSFPQTNTSLTSSITIDVYQNKLRIFESSGANRGGYWDITALSAGVGTNFSSGGSGTSGTSGTSGGGGGGTGSSTATVGFTIDGQGGVITVGTKNYVYMPYAATITGWAIISSVTGSTVIDVWKSNNDIPTSANSIAGTEKPTLSNQRIATDTNLSSWTTSISVGDIIAFNVDSATTVTNVNVVLSITKT